jgi:VWFA-related protein
MQLRQSGQRPLPSAGKKPVLHEGLMRTQLCLLLVSGLLGSALAQDPLPKSGPRSGSTTSMRLDVVVTPKSGTPVGSLTQQDFTLLDNQAVQPLTSFRAEGSGAPVEVVIVLDAVNANYTTVSYARQQLDKYLSADEGQLARPTTLAILSDKGIQAQGGFTRNGKELMTTLDQQVVALRTIGRDTGFYGAQERLDDSLKGLRLLVQHEATVPGRKLILFISPGWPLLSGVRVDLSRTQQEGILHQVMQLSAELQQAHVTLYQIDPRGNNAPLESRVYYQNYLKPVVKPGQAEIADLSLQVLAIHSGGLVLNASNDVADLVQRAVADASNFYEITFVPPPSEHPDEYHAIQVKVAQPGLTARTIDGYYTYTKP